MTEPLQTEEEAKLTLEKLSEFHSMIVEDIGEYTTRTLKTGRIAVIPEDTGPEDAFLAYLTNDRLIIDDYCLPEEAEELLPGGTT